MPLDDVESQVVEEQSLNLQEPATPSLVDMYVPLAQPATSSPEELQFFSERNAYLWTVPNDSQYEDYNAALDAAESTLSQVDKPTAQVLYSAGSAKVMQEIRGVQEGNIDYSGTPEEISLATDKLNYYRQLEEASKAAPEAAVSSATVEALTAFEDTNDIIRNSLVLRDMQVGSVSKRMGASGFAKKALDFGVAVIVGPRAMVGQMKFAESFNPNEYFNMLKNWKNLTAREKAELWPNLEQQLWDASGNNDFVYLGVVNPFIDEEDEIWARVDQVSGIGSLVAGLFAATRMYKVLKGIQKPMKFRELALRSGNLQAAGKATATAVKKGDASAIIEGSGVLPKEEFFPELVDGLSGPTQQVMIEERLTEIKIGGLSDEMQAARIQRETSRLVKKGVVKDVAKNEAGFDITLIRPSTDLVPIKQVRTNRANLVKEIKDRTAELKELLKDTTAPGNMDKAAELTSTLRYLKLQRKEIDAKLKAAKATSKASGLKVTGLPFPGTKEEVIPFRWTVDDQTGVLDFAENQPNLLQYLGMSKESTLDNVSEEVQTYMGSIADMQQRRVYADHARFIRNVEEWFRKPFIGKLFSKKSKGRVEAILQRGDVDEVIYAESDLRKGVLTDAGMVKLDDKEIEAYYGARLAFDNLWYALNGLQRKQLEFAGYSAFRVKYTAKDGREFGTTVFAKARVGGKTGTVPDITYKIPEVGTGNAKYVMDARTGTPVELASVAGLEEDLRKLKKGFVQLKTPFHTADGKQYRHMLVDLDDGLRVKQAQGVPYNVLPYRRGYVPKMASEPVHHVVEAMDDLIVNGVKVRDKRVIAGFQSAREARIYINRKNAAYMAKTGAKIEDSPAELWKAVPLNSEYRRVNAEQMDLVNNSIFRGTFGGHRTDGVFKIGLEEKEATRIGAFEAMQRYADYVGRHTPMHEFRENMIRLFLNSSEGMLEVKGDWSSRLTSTSDPRYRAAKSMQDWMQSTFAIPTSEERFFQKFTDHLSLSLDSVIYKNDMGDLRVGAWATKRMQQRLIGSKWANDPIQAAKGFAFDMYLGMFNPIQLLVQTAGIAIPMSLHPLESAAAFRNFVGLRTLFGMADVDSAVIAAKAMGYDPKQFRSMLMAFKSSGVADSILANSDFGYFSSSRFGYYSPGLWENIKKSGRVFYNMGELNNRTFAWTLAYERLARANKWNLAKARTSEEIVEITREGLRLGMNMTQANRSKSQTMGSTALMTQFWKVTMQFYENALSGLFNVKKGAAWTRKESAAALLNSTFMLGAANFSIDELWTQYEGWLIDQFNLDTSDPKHKEFIAFWRGGFLELMTFKSFDYEMDISDRIGVASGVNMIYENLRNLVLVFSNDEDANILKSVMGASYGIKTRTHTAIAEVLDVFRVAGEVETINTAMAESVLRSMWGITSAGNNALNAMLWKNANAIMVKGTGERLGDLPGSQVWIGKALGIDPLTIEKYYMVDKKSRKYDRLKADISKEIAQLARQLYLSGQYTEAGERELVRMKMHLLVADLDAVDRETVLGNALNILDEDTKTEKMILKLIDGLIKSTTDEEAKEKHRDLQILKGLENE